MKGFKKAAAYVVGSMVIAGAGAYFAMPKEAKQNLKEMIGNMANKKNNKNINERSASTEQRLRKENKK